MPAATAASRCRVWNSRERVASYAPPRTTLADIARHFDTLEDPRCHINRHYPLTSVVVIAILAILAGANGPTAIATWARTKKELLRQGLSLPGGVPCKDVFRTVLTLLNPQVFKPALPSG